MFLKLETLFDQKEADDEDNQCFKIHYGKIDDLYESLISSGNLSL